MKFRFISAALLLGTLTAYSQKPAAKPPAKTPAPAAAAAPTVTPTTSAATLPPERVKDLKDALTMVQLDQMEIQTAQNKFIATDPIARKAMQVLRDQTESAPEVKKARDQADTDGKVLKDKIDSARKALGLGEEYDWDFNQNKFIQVKSQPGANPAPATGAKPSGE